MSTWKLTAEKEADLFGRKPKNFGLSMGEGTKSLAVPGATLWGRGEYHTRDKTDALIPGSPLTSSEMTGDELKLWDEQYQHAWANGADEDEAVRTADACVIYYRQNGTGPSPALYMRGSYLRGSRWIRLMGNARLSAAMIRGVHPHENTIQEGVNWLINVLGIQNMDIRIDLFPSYQLPGDYMQDGKMKRAAAPAVYQITDPLSVGMDLQNCKPLDYHKIIICVGPGKKLDSQWELENTLTLLCHELIHATQFHRLYGDMTPAQAFAEDKFQKIIDYNHFGEKGYSTQVPWEQEAYAWTHAYADEMMRVLFGERDQVEDDYSQWYQPQKSEKGWSYHDDDDIEWDEDEQGSFLHNYDDTKPCMECGGTGGENGQKGWQACRECNGTGVAPGSSWMEKYDDEGRWINDDLDQISEEDWKKFRDGLDSTSAWNDPAEWLNKLRKPKWENLGPMTYNPPCPGCGSTINLWSGTSPGSPGPNMMAQHCPGCGLSGPHGPFEQSVQESLLKDRDVMGDDPLRFQRPFQAPTPPVRPPEDPDTGNSGLYIPKYFGHVSWNPFKNGGFWPHLASPEAAINAKNRALVRIQGSPLAPQIQQIIEQLPPELWRFYDWLAVQVNRGTLQAWITQWMAETERERADEAEMLAGEHGHIEVNDPRFWMSQVLFLLNTGGALMEEARQRGQAPDLTAMRWADFLRWYQEAQYARVIKEQPYKQVNVIYTFQNGWTMVQITDPQDLQLEGELMGHCVGQARYQQELADGISQIYSLRDPQGVPHGTVYMQGKTIKDIRGQTNTVPKPEYKAMIQEWLDSRNPPQPEPVTDREPAEPEQETAPLELQPPAAPRRPFDE